MARTVSSSAQQLRDPDLREMDRQVLKEIAQAAVDVELFTIPLYMTSLYSIEGWHPITGRNSQLYQGRIWPGAKSSAAPTTDNERAFNIVFSVFIQEMLHLQMAANMASVVGVHPDFERLQDGEYGWPCYGPNNSIIPHIIDLRDTTSSADLKVNVGPLDEERIRLFLAIEAPEKVAEADIPEANRGKYFPKAPFVDWYPAQGLPLFGTIGWMYQCYYDYLNLRYEDGVSMWDAVWADVQASPPVQNDLFNAVSGGHPMREFLGFNTVVATTYPDIAFSQMVAMMDAITDQGEGSVIDKRVQLLAAVEPIYCPNDDALRSDYPSYDDKGALIPSADAAARFGNDGADHYERFTEVKGMIDAGTITTWDRAGAPRVFTAEELQTADWATNPYKANMPGPDEVAAALTRMSADAANSGKVLSEAVVGAIAGVTSVLGDYWNPQGAAPLFPYPSMVGSGDRMAIAWAVLGACPDLRKGIGSPAKGVLRHACQGLAFESAGGNSCADPKIFHSCKGSNNCHAQGGCGFVQLVTGGGNCSSSGGGGSGGGGGGGGNCSSNGCGSTALSLRAFGGLCGGPTPPPPSGPLYSAPSDNKCKGFGGCAVPISASQLYPTTGTMQLFAFDTIDGKITSAPIGTLDYKVGDAVADIAYAAFAKAVEANHKQPQPQPPANDLRLVFPPST